MLQIKKGFDKMGMNRSYQAVVERALTDYIVKLERENAELRDKVEDCKMPLICPEDIERAAEVPGMNSKTERKD